MKLEIKMKHIGMILGIIIFSIIVYQALQYLKPVKTIFIKGTPFSFREDIRKALDVEIFPEGYVLHELFTDFKLRNITVVFKPGSPETNGIYQLETFEIVYKMSRYDDLTRGMFRPKKEFSGEPIESYDNITREDKVLKVILIPPEFSNQTRVLATGNKIWIYGKTEKEFDHAVMKAILSMMNVTSLEGHV